MIYLIESYRKIEDDVDNGICRCEKLLKIGYTGDDKCDYRFYTYRAHNPGVELVHMIHNGTEEQERKLHNKFKDLKFDTYNEWFKYDQEIVDYIKNTTLKELDELERSIPESRISKTKEDYEISAKLRREVDICYDQLSRRKEEITIVCTETYKDLRKRCSSRRNIKGRFNTDYFFQVLKLTEEERERALKIIKLDYSDRPEREQRFFTEFDKEGQFVQKMKLLCEYDFTGEELDYILKQLPSEFAKYYYTLGPEIIKSRAYNRSYLEKDYTKLMFNSESMVLDIYSVFNEGDKLSTQEIVSKLATIYEKQNNPNKPKAKDIGEYFEIKAAKIYFSETGKEINGYRLIKRLK